ncbi:MAG: ATP-binding cassette domain-containing protein [Acidobacteria bacterium]|nr:ATP-binding cassette domain-containing protein [Acidobacteriota bacterium]
MDSPALLCESLVKVYPPDVRAVDGLDLEVPRGECFGLLGPNGAGKTTTVEICEGLLEPTSGRVEILGRRWADAGRALRLRIGVSLQETRLPEKASALETARLFRSFYDDGLEPLEVLREVGLESKADAWVGKLSGGQKRRLEIACALVGRPELLFLDEPTTGLDPQARRQLWEVIRRLRAEGRTVLLTTHYMDEAEQLCDRVAIIDKGRVIALGSPEELIGALGGDRVLEVVLDGPAPPPDESFWRERVQDVCEARVDGDRALLSVNRPHIAIPSLLEAIAAAGRSLEDLKTRHATLEDVFLKLTGRTLEGESR